MTVKDLKTDEGPSRLVHVPISFGDDPLSAFLSTANDNVVASYVNQAEWFKRFRDIDEALLSVHAEAPEPELPPRLLLSRTIAAFRASCRAAMSGCPVEAAISIRATLEAALYALHIAEDESNFETWANRDDGEEQRKKCRKVFTKERVMATLRGKNPELWAIAESIYDDSIDFGAHPNQQAIFGDLTLRRTEATVEISLNHIVGAESPSYKVAMRSTALVGLCVLSIALEVFPSCKTAALSNVVERLNREQYPS